ncbi:META domain-containing protein [Niabella hibiscisoli]|uniref:META domain-containing protein n=1 Tax=Niabella hibiscisoli TaxID=1825928 RepID=UPI001F0EA980|nr:META domain-containing protein [Niabella hibiscisoli]MCH5716595.1 META domain-containing protein [Niabella hibiscisoli]
MEKLNAANEKQSNYFIRLFDNSTSFSCKKNEASIAKNEAEAYPATGERTYTKGELKVEESWNTGLPVDFSGIWKVIEFNGIVADDKQPLAILTVASDTTVNMAANCNSFIYKYRINGSNKISLNAYYSSVMACKNFYLDKNIMSVFNTVVQYKILNKVLKLGDAEGKVFMIATK